MEKLLGITIASKFKTKTILWIAVVQTFLILIIVSFLFNLIDNNIPKDNFIAGISLLIVIALTIFLGIIFLVKKTFITPDAVVIQYPFLNKIRKIYFTELVSCNSKNYYYQGKWFQYHTIFLFKTKENKKFKICSWEYSNFKEIALAITKKTVQDPSIKISTRVYDFILVSLVIGFIVAMIFLGFKFRTKYDWMFK